MGGFAVCRAKPESKIVALDGCHVNVWVLPALVSSAEFYFDLGVVIRVDQDAADERLAIYLPFDSEGAIDLSERLNNNAASLIFGEEARVGDGLITLVAGGREYSLLDLTSKVTKDDASVKSPDHHSSVWNVELPALKKDRLHYFRIRFTTRRLGRLYQQKVSGLRTNGGQFDLRFVDDRDWVQAKVRANRDLILPIERLQVFVIASAQYQMKVVSPALRYVRLLEGGGQWDDYLGRSPGRSRTDRFLIYYWKLGRWKTKNDAGEEAFQGDAVYRTNPARLFLDVSRDFGYLSWPNYLRFFLLTAFLLLLFPYQETRGAVVGYLSALLGGYRTAIGLGLASVLALALLAVNRAKAAYKNVKEWLPFIRKGGELLERMLYHKRS